MYDVNKWESLSSAAKDVMMQLFLNGPTWDGNIIAKNGRGELCENNLAFHTNGWASLNEHGVIMASEVNVKTRNDQRWYNKQNQLKGY